MENTPENAALETLTRSELRVRVQAAGLGGTCTAAASKGDLVAAIVTGTRSLAGRPCDAKGAVLAANGGAAPEAATPASGAANVASAIAAAVQTAIGGMLSESLDAERITAIARASAQEWAEDAGLFRPTEYVLPDGRTLGKVEGRKHRHFDRVAKTLRVLRRAFLAGPTGSGKTYMAQQLAQALSLPFYAVSCSGGMSESWIVGRTLVTGTYVAAPFVTAWRDGGVFLLDEVDAAPADVLLILNSALANDVLVIPSTGERIDRHADCYVVAAGNTLGRSYSADYSARQPLDLATRNRFAACSFWIDYDVKVERAIARAAFGEGRNEEADGLVDALLAIRKAIAKTGTEGIAMATRQIADASLIVASGAATQKEVIATLLLSLASDEKSRILSEAGTEAEADAAE
jgi:MoxR-like ATPase